MVAGESSEQVPLWRCQQGRATGSVGVRQGRRVVVAAVSGEPMVHRARSHPESQSDCSDRFAGSDFEDGEGAAVQTGVVGAAQLPLQMTPLPEGQGQGLHGFVLPNLHLTDFC